MKLAFGFVFLFITTVFSYAQQEDTIRVKFQMQSLPLIPDSLRSDQNQMKKKPVIPDYKNIENNVFLLENEKMTFNFERPGKKTVFNSSYSPFVIPAALISYGALARVNKSLKELDESTNHEVGEHVLKHIPFDDYTQYAPAIAVYGLDFAGIKAKHNFRDRTLVITTSYLVMGITVQTMKTTTNVERPDSSNRHSFPSGHTATAFVGAHILFKEYKDTSPWIGIAGYGVAVATGTIRVLNKKHWVSDVVAGAGVGVFSAEISYMLLPVWHRILRIKEKNKTVVIVPMVSSESAGLGMSYTF